MPPPSTRGVAEEIDCSPGCTSNSDDSSVVDYTPDDVVVTDNVSSPGTCFSGPKYDCDISLGALWTMIKEFHSIERDSTALSDYKTSFVELFVSETFRIGFFIELEENQQEIDAKTLLSEVDDCLLKSSIDGVGSSCYLKMKAKTFAASSLHLHSFRLQAKENLRDVAFQGDKIMGTDCALVLTEKLSVAPWRASSTLAVVLSDVNEAIRSAQSNQAPGSQKWEAPSCFQRATTKYWVEEDKLLELLLACVIEVPLLVYGRSGRLTLPQDISVNESDKLWRTLASPISSVYFDSPKSILYNERIARKEGAQLLRVRWYGKKPKGDGKVFVELKTHHEKWINTASVKERVTIKEKHMLTLLERKTWSYQDAEPIVREGNPKLSADELSRAVDLLLRMHDLILHHDLRPCVRSVYLRAAFQLPTTNALRLTIDRDITMIDETGTAKEDWCLPDDAIDPSRVKRVPFPVFEVKLAGSEMPASIAALIANGVVEEAAKFSKFLTGVASFNPNNVRTLPYWAEHPAFQVMMFPVAASKPSCRTNDAATTAMVKPLIEHSQVKPVVEDPTPRKQLSDISLTRLSSRTSLLAAGIFRRGDKKPAIAPKRPARVEPKSYFANERTFIQWTSASLWLLTVAALLVERDLTGTTYLSKVAVALCLGAVFVLIHSFRLYFLRIRLMEQGNPNGYVDRIGPVVLSGVVLMGIMVLLVSKTQAAFFPTSSQPQPLRIASGQCYQHSISGISALKYQPSDVVVDREHRMLLVPSLDRIVGHSTANLNVNVTTLVAIPGTDLEGLTMAGDRIFALSEATGHDTDKSGALIELAWEDSSSLPDIQRLKVVQRYDIGDDMVLEGLTFIPGEDGGSLCIDQDQGILTLFKLPPRVDSTDSVFEDSTKKQLSLSGPVDVQKDPTISRLSKQDGMNKKLMISGLLDGKIGSLYFFEGILYVLHDNDLVIRTWDVATGEMQFEIALPFVGDGFEKQWEGLAITRNDGSFPALWSGLRGKQSPLILHLALDSPPQVWSIAVEEGEGPGQIVYPDCAGV